MPVIPFSSASRAAGVADDITERVEAEEAKRYREAADAKLKELMNTPVKRFDPNGGTPMIDIPEPVTGGWRVRTNGDPQVNADALPGGAFNRSVEPELDDPVRDEAGFGPVGEWTEDLTRPAAPEGDAGSVGMGSGGPGGEGGLSDQTISDIRDRFRKRKEGDSMRELRARMLSAPNADQAAIDADLAERQGVNRLEVERNRDTFVAVDRAQAIDELRKTAPKLRAWLDYNPANLEVAHDDVESLGWWEQTAAFFSPGNLSIDKVGQALQSGFVDKIPEQLYGLDQMLGDANASIYKALPDWFPGKFGLVNEQVQRSLMADMKRQEMAAQGKANAPVGETWLERGIYGAAQSAPSTLVSLAITAVTKSPVVGSGSMGATTAGGAYGEARDQGKSLGDAFRYALTQGGIETATEFIPLKFLVDDLAKDSSFAKTFFRQAAAEGITEQAATFLQDASTFIALSPDKTLGEFLAERPNAALETLVASTIMSGVTTTVAKGMQAAGDQLDQNAKQKRAEDLAKFIDKAVDNGANSKLLKRGTVGADKYREAVAASTDAKFRIDSDAITALAQEEGVTVEQIAQAFRIDPDEMVTAIDTGSDVLVPVGNYVAAIQTAKKEIGLDGGAIHTALGPNMRVGENDLTAREQASFAAAIAEEQAAREKTRAEAAKPLTLETLPQQLLMLARDARGGTVSKSGISGSEREMLEEAGYKPDEEGNYDLNDLVAEADRRRAAGTLNLSMSQYDNSHITDWETKRKGRDAGEAFADAADRVRNTIREAVTATGLFNADAANTQAELVGSIVTTLAERTGQDPEALWKEQGFDIVASLKGEDTDPDGLAQSMSRQPVPIGDVELEFASKELSPQEFEAWKGARDGLSNEQIAERMNAVEPDAVVSSDDVKRWLFRSRERGYDSQKPHYNDRGTDPKTLRLIELRARGVKNPQIAAALYPDVDTQTALNRVKALASKNKAKIEERRAALEGAKSLAQEEGSRDLPMDEASRMSRAREMGFDVDTPLYHGTNKNFDEFDTSAEIRNANEAGSAVYLTPDPEAAGSYAKGWREAVFGPNEITDGENIRPVYARLRNPYTINVRSQSEDLGMTAEEAASIRAAGYDGIIVRTVELDGQGRLVPGSEKPFEYVVFDPKNIRGKFAKFDPSESSSSKLLAQTQRGTFTPREDRNVIRLFESANLSTLAHEGSHWYLDTLWRMSKTENPHPFVLEQLAAVLEWHGKSPNWDAMFNPDGSFTKEGVDLQEAFAESFEAYLMEGKAPTTALRSVFASFKQWLLSIYKGIVSRIGGRARLNDEIRQVFDRMLATDEAIKAVHTGLARDGEAMAKAILDKQDPDGKWKPERREKFMERMRERYAAARERAEAALMARLMDEFQRTKQAAWRDEERQVKREVQAEVDARPEQRAFAWLAGRGWRETDEDRLANEAATEADAMRALAQAEELGFYEANATDASIQALQAKMVENGIIPIVLLFRTTSGRVIAFPGDSGNFGMHHDMAREVFGLGDLKMQHGVWNPRKWPTIEAMNAADTAWYDTTGTAADTIEAAPPQPRVMRGEAALAQGGEGLLVYRGSGDTELGAGRLGTGLYLAEDPEIGAEWGGEAGTVDAYRITGKLFDLTEETAQGLENYAKRENTPAAERLFARLKAEGFVGIRDPWSGHINVFDAKDMVRTPENDAELGKTWTNYVMEVEGDPSLAQSLYRGIPTKAPPIEWIRDTAMETLGPADMLAYINNKYPAAGPNSSPPYFVAASEIRRASGDRRAAAQNLASYIQYQTRAKAAPDAIENAKRALRAIPHVHPMFFDDAVFNERMTSQITAGGESLRDALRKARADDGISAEIRAEAAIRATGPRSLNQTVQPSRQLDAMGFYSAAQEAAQRVPDGIWQMGWQAARNSLAKGRDGVVPRKTEIEYLGLDAMFGDTKLKGAALKDAVLEHIAAKRLSLVENFARFDPNNLKTPTKRVMLREMEGYALADAIGLYLRPMGEGRVSIETDIGEDKSNLYLQRTSEALSGPRYYDLIRYYDGGKREVIANGVEGDLRGKIARLIVDENFAKAERNIGVEALKNEWLANGENKLVRGPGDIRLPGEDVPLFEAVIGLPEGVPGSDYRAPVSHVGGKAKGTLVTAHGEERIDDKGQRTVFVGQVQSDMAQQAREDKNDAPHHLAVIKLLAENPDAQWFGIDAQGEYRPPLASDSQRDLIARGTLERSVEGFSRVADTPLLSTSEWTNVAVRSMLYRAAREGFQSISFPTAETSEIIQGNDSAAMHYETNVKGALEKLAKQLGGEVRRGGVEAGIERGLISADMSVLLSNYGSLSEALDFRRGQLSKWESSGNTGAQAEKVKKELRKEIADLERMERDANGTQLASAYILDITPGMRAKIMSEGFPLFQTGDDKGRATPPPNLPPMRLNLQAVKEQYGEQALAEIPPDVAAYSAEANDVEAYVQIARDVRKTLNETPPKSLWKFLSTPRNIGQGEGRISYRGIRDTDGELLKIIGEKKAARGLIADPTKDSKRSRSYDMQQAIEAAWEAGYFDGEDLPTPAQFLDTLRADIDGQAPRYRRDDIPTVSTIAGAERWKEWFEQNDLDITSDVATMRAKLATVLTGQGTSAIGPDEAAEVFNGVIGSNAFPTGFDLLKALKQGPMRDKLIRDLTEQRMIERNGDVFRDGTIMAEAEAYARNEVQHRQFEIELEALAEAAGKGTASALAKQTAIENLRSKQVREVLNYTQWLTLERRWAEKAIKAAAKGDTAQAAEFARFRLINSYMYSEGKKLAEKIEKTRKHLLDYGKKAKQVRLFAAGKEYQETMNGLLADYQFRNESKKGESQRAARAIWIRAQMASIDPYAAYQDTTKSDAERQAEAAEALEKSRTLAALAEGGDAKGYKSLTVDELLAVRDEADMIWRMATMADQLLKQGERRRLSLAAGDVAAEIETNQPNEKPPEPIETDSPGEGLKRSVMKYFAMHRTLQSLARQFAGGKDGGKFWAYIVKPLNEAFANLSTLRKQMGADMKDLFSAYTEDEQKRMFRDRRTHDFRQAGGPRIILSKQGRLAFALNWGNDKNRRRLMDSLGLDEGMVGQVLDALDKRDWDFVQKTWDYLDTWFPEANRVHEAVHGAPMSKEAPLEVATRFGIYRGGYYPIVFDPKLSSRTGQRQMEADAKSFTGQVGARNEPGFAKKRTSGKVTLPLRLSVLDVIASHLDKVATSIATEEALFDAGRIVKQPAVETAIVNRHGREIYNTIVSTLVTAKFGLEGASGILAHLRNGATVVGLGWKVSTALLQPLGISNSIVRVGGFWIAKGYAAMGTDAVMIRRRATWATEKSEFMRNRRQANSPEMAALRGQLKAGVVDLPLPGLGLGKKAIDAIKNNAFAMMANVQFYSVDVPTWYGALFKAQAAGMSEADAVASADQAVIDAQGGGELHQTAAMQTGAGTRYAAALRLLTNFMSYMITTYNIATQRARNARTPAQIAALAMDFAILLAIPVAGKMALDAWTKGGGDDDEEDPLWEKYAREQVAFIFSPFVGISQIAGTARGEDAFGYRGPAGLGIFAEATNAGKAAAEADFDESFWRPANRTAGMIFHYPAGQLDASIRGAAAYFNGETDNPAAFLVGPPPAN